MLTGNSIEEIVQKCKGNPVLRYSLPESIETIPNLRNQRADNKYQVYKTEIPFSLNELIEFNTVYIKQLKP